MTTQVIFANGSKSWAHQIDDLRERWSIRREEQNKREWMPVDLFAEDIKKLSRPDLLLLKVQLLEVSKEVKKTLDNIRANARLGQYADPNWFNNTRAASRSVGLHIQVIDRELSNRLAERRPRLNKKYHDVPNHFVDVAKERLSPEIYFELLNEAKKRDIEIQYD